MEDDGSADEVVNVDLVAEELQYANEVSVDWELDIEFNDDVEEEEEEKGVESEEFVGFC